MGNVVVSAGNGGGIMSDDLTAVAAHVLSGDIYLGSDTDDDVGTGTMPNNNTLTSNGTVPGISEDYPNIPTRQGTNLQYNTDTNGTNRISICPPKGYYSGGSYVNRPASDFGNANKADVLTGKTFTSSAGLKAAGTLADDSGYTKSAAASLDTANSRLQMTIPETAKYSTASKLYATYSTIRTLIGLTAEKLWANTTILGLKSSRTAQTAKTWTPGTADQTIAAGTCITGAQTIKGDSNLIAANIKKGIKIFGVTGTAYRSAIVDYTAYDGNISYNGYSGTSGDRKVSAGSPYSEWDTVVMQIKAVTEYCGPVCIALSKGKSMRVPVTTTKYSDGRYENAWLSVARSSSGEITLAPFSGTISGTYRTQVQIFAVCDGTINNEA